MRYFDSGVLLKLYLSEPNSAQAVALVQEQGSPIYQPPLFPSASSAVCRRSPRCIGWR